MDGVLLGLEVEVPVVMMCYCRRTLKCWTCTALRRHLLVVKWGCLSRMWKWVSRTIRYCHWKLAFAVKSFVVLTECPSNKDYIAVSRESLLYTHKLNIGSTPCQVLLDNDHPGCITDCAVDSADWKMLPQVSLVTGRCPEYQPNQSMRCCEPCAHRHCSVREEF